MKALGMFVIIALIAAGGLFYWVFTQTGALVEESNQFFERVASNKLQDAYDATSATFKKNTDFSTFQSFVKNLGLDGYLSASWPSRNINNDEGRIEGTVKTRDGREFTMQVDFKKEDGRWRVLGLRPVGTVPSASPGVKTATQPFPGFSPAATPVPVATATPVASETPMPTSTTPGGAPTKWSAEDGYVSEGGVPDEDQLHWMSENSLLSFNSAVKNEDFKWFHKELAKPFRDKYTPEQLKEVFQQFIDKEIDISAITGEKEEFTKEPSLDEKPVGKILSYQVTYRVKPTVVADLDYLEEDGHWKLVGINVNVK